MGYIFINSLCTIYFWMVTMCCEVSYLYIGLLTQPSYLTYVGFLNSFYYMKKNSRIVRVHDYYKLIGEALVFSLKMSSQISCSHILPPHLYLLLILSLCIDFSSSSLFHVPHIFIYLSLSPLELLHLFISQIDCTSISYLNTFV